MMVAASHDAFSERRLNERCPVEEAALLRCVAARNQPRPPSRRVTIVNVSVRGAGLRVAPGIALEPGRTIELGIDGDWSRCRVIWVSPGTDGGTVGGVAFVDARPSFLPALLRWIERESAASDRMPWSARG